MSKIVSFRANFCSFFFCLHDICSDGVRRGLGGWSWVVLLDFSKKIRDETFIVSWICIFQKKSITLHTQMRHNGVLLLKGRFANIEIILVW